MEWTGGVDHGIVAPSVDELIEGTVWGHVRNDAEGSLASFFGSENRLGLNRLSFRTDGGLDRMVVGNELLDSRNADKSTAYNQDVSAYDEAKKFSPASSNENLDHGVIKESI